MWFAVVVEGVTSKPGLSKTEGCGTRKFNGVPLVVWEDGPPPTLKI
jgi:hypothetical protein